MLGERGGFQQPKPKEHEEDQLENPGRRKLLQVAVGLGAVAAVEGISGFFDSPKIQSEPAKASPIEVPSPPQIEEIKKNEQGGKSREKEKDKEHAIILNPNPISREINRLAKDIKDPEQKKQFLEKAKVLFENNTDILQDRISGNIHGEPADEAYLAQLFLHRKDLLKVFKNLPSRMPPEILFNTTCIEGAKYKKGGDRKGQKGPMGWFRLDAVIASGYPKGNPLLQRDKHGNVLIDDRDNLERSAKAATEYLLFLYNQFGEQWGLALSAFAGGDGKLRGRIRKAFKGVVWNKKYKKFEKDSLQENNVNIVSLAQYTKRDKKGKIIHFRDLGSTRYPFQADALGEKCLEAINRMIGAENKRMTKAK